MTPRTCSARSMPLVESLTPWAPGWDPEGRSEGVPVCRWASAGRACWSEEAPSAAASQSALAVAVRAAAAESGLVVAEAVG
jgi:hypothetical protein